jgi:hypothetical protein
MDGWIGWQGNILCVCFVEVFLVWYILYKFSFLFFSFLVYFFSLFVL